MTKENGLPFSIAYHTSPVPAQERERQLQDPGFGTLFTDHMASIHYREGEGWYNARIEPRRPIAMDPACAVLHYAQEIFEGMKAYRLPDGTAALFRPDANARRFNLSAQRMAMPTLPEEIFLHSISELVKLDNHWIPPIEGGSLYLRPFMYASEVFLGVRPAREYRYLVIASPVGSYFKGGASAVTIWVSHDYSRAAPGGTGAAKCGGNYAASLIAQTQASAHGCDQVAFLDAAERRWVEELGGMNLFFVMEDGSMITPPLGGTILPGITRDSIIRLARDEGVVIREQAYAMEQWEADARSGQLRECFACGTAAVVTAVGTVKSAEGQFTIGNGNGGALTDKLRSRLVGIQQGKADDPHGWIRRLDQTA